MYSLTFVLCACVAALGKADDLLIRTAQGVVRGDLMTTYTGQDILAFRGLRYAEPPVGSNRFKPPIPPKPWSGIYNATGDNIHSKIVCPQPFPDELGPSSEDCLFLNVYTKQINGSKPVIFFIHPGSYSEMTGASNWLGPEYLLDKDIVLVTINYRLGALGYLSMQDKLLKGNYGMKDQVAALRWVKQNIAYFGGDPHAVTLMGNSAGAASVMMHMLSPMSRGLFHRCIAMSGSATLGWATNRNPTALSLRLTEALGCNGTSPQEVYNCLKELPAQAVSNATIELKDFQLYPLAFFAPVIEKDYGDGEERFLTAEPLELIRTGQFAQVPLITGVTKDEVAGRGYYLLRNATLAEELDTNFDHYAPVEFMYDGKDLEAKKITHTLRKFYFADRPIDNSTRERLGQLYADSNIIFGNVQAAKLFAEKSTAPVYYYMLSYAGRLGHSNSPGSTTPSGVMNRDAMIYLFHISTTFPKINATDPEATMVRTLTSTWTEFAKTGVPTLTDSSIQWPSLNSGKHHYLNISHTLDVVPGMPYPERMSLWESLFPVTGPHQVSY